jgi:hypothetical protein
MVLCFLLFYYLLDIHHIVYFILFDILFLNLSNID